MCRDSTFLVLIDMIEYTGQDGQRFPEQRASTHEAIHADGVPSIATAAALFEETLVAKSRRTAANYRSALRRFGEFVEATGRSWTQRTDQLPADVLEQFYAWLIRSYGREHRSTAVTYVAEVRAFFRFLDRRRWLRPDVSYERMKDGLRELIGRQPYRTPRIDDAVVLIVTYVDAMPLSSASGRQERLVVLRDRALLRTLFATGMRREEVSRLNRADLQDGRVAEGLITGKGSRERIVFFDDESLRAIRAYLTVREDTHLPLFLRHDDGRGRAGAHGEHWRLSPHSVWCVVKKYAAASGIAATPHLLRHLKARTLLNEGAQLAEVQDILGHASPETTKRIYAPYTRQHLRDAFDRFSLPAETIAARVRARETRSR
jgi:site-specific recombinase XerD